MRNIFLLAGIIGGLLFPYGHGYVFLIRYLLISMLFFSFLDLRVQRSSLQKSHFYILMVLLLLPPALYILLRLLSPEIALGVFITALAPTAIAAPVIISLRGGKVEYVVISLVLNFLAVTLLVPFMLPLLLGSGSGITVQALFVPVISTLGIPFAAAYAVRFLFPKAARALLRFREVNFVFIVVNLYIAVSDASVYLRSNTAAGTYLAGIALASFLLCILNFWLGWRIGGKEFGREASQALGQKNNGFTIWISVTYLSPLAAIGPVFYILFQYAYITYELHKLNSVKNTH